MDDRTLILGAGMTGLAAGMASGLPVLEAAAHPGGICCSYYVVPGSDQPLAGRPEADDAYRFETGGGHWLFGGSPAVLRGIAGLVPLARYVRRSSVFFPDRQQYVPYPIQNHLRCLDRELALAALEEMARPPWPATTMADWFLAHFGATLNRAFFAPFHELYTAGLHRLIAPQDAYKSPQSLAQALRGAFEDTPAAGYNTTFAYPEGGLDLLARRMAARCRIEFDRRVVRIDPGRRLIAFADGSARPYEALLSTLPLNRVMEMTGLSTAAAPDPFTSVLVVNIGAIRGAGLPGRPLALPAAVRIRMPPGRVLQQRRSRLSAGGGARGGGPGQPLRRALVPRRAAAGGSGDRGPWSPGGRGTAALGLHRAGRGRASDLDRRRLHLVLARLELAGGGVADPAGRGHLADRALRPLAVPGHRRVDRGGLRRRRELSPGR